jgi:alpha-1,2-rhamnosyltransferase
MPRILIDCTVTYWNPDLIVGIQRVVREIVRRAGDDAPPGVECIPVIHRGQRWKRVESPAPSPALRSLRRRCDLAKLARRSARQDLAGGNLLSLFPLVYQALRYLACSLAFRLARSLAVRRMQQVRPAQGDILLLPDFIPGAQKGMERLRAEGVRIVAVVHDIIPLTHPEYVQRPHEPAAWFKWLAENADRILAVSGYVEGTLRERWPDRRWSTGHFHLGADFVTSPSSAPTPALRAALGGPCFLMVGTIEPRKGHAVALQAFRKLWAAGSPARLLIIGRVGWMVDDLMRDLRSSPELGRRLHVLTEASDDDLAAAYAGATALLAASKVEGFGLPVVEALRAGLPVLASDIPVFREVAGQSADYFPPDSPDALAAKLAAWTDHPPSRRTGRAWRGWDESVADLIRQASSPDRPR